MAGLAATNAHLLEAPIVEPLARYVEAMRWGLLQKSRLPRWAKTLAGVLLMDYTMYWWHIATHRASFLWRFHAVHHVDLDMDASTAVRFHVGELILSVPFRALQITLLGIDRRSLRAWQMMLSLCVLFHHSDIRLAPEFEKFLATVVVTPRMHGLHHADDPVQGASNWSSGLSIWDRIHGTMSIPREQPTVGVRGIDRPKQVTLPKLLIMPLDVPEPVRLFPAAARQAHDLNEE